MRAYQAFDLHSSAHVRELGLTPSQFDAIATLGNTRGMPMYELGEKTLTTKGTLTGIVDRVERKWLVRRQVRSEDRRCFNVVLTPKGTRLFEAIFPAHIAHLEERFWRMNEAERERLRRIAQIACSRSAASASASSGGDSTRFGEAHV